jgi:hypothetical protein
MLIKSLDFSRGNWGIVFIATLLMAFLISKWSSHEASSFFYKLTSEIVKRELLPKLNLPKCRYASIDFSTFEVVNECSLETSCNKNIEVAFRFSPFFGTSTFPDTVAEKVAYVCPEMLRVQVLKEVLTNTQKGG